MLERTLAFAVLAASALQAGAATTRVVCPQGAADASCQFTGNGAIQQAVDAATDGDTVLIRAGTYSPESFRDVPFGKLTIRGYVVVDGKDINIAGEPGTILDGDPGKPASAIVTRGGRIGIRDLTLRDFRAADPEDDIYDGHGLFFIDTHATVADVTIERVRKMAFTVRGTGDATATALRILDGHVGIWLEETAHLTLRDALVSGNESAGICAYGNSSASIEHSTFEKNRDDGLYTEDEATIDARDSKIVDNQPLNVHATGKSRISVEPTSPPSQ